MRIFFSIYLGLSSGQAKGVTNLMCYDANFGQATAIGTLLQIKIRIPPIVANNNKL